MSELEKNQFQKIRLKKLKKTENQCQNATCEQKTTSEKWKFASNKKVCYRSRMNYEWIGKTI